MIFFSTKLRACFKSSIMSFTASSPTANPTNPSKGCSYRGAFGIVFYVANFRKKQKITLANDT